MPRKTKQNNFEYWMKKWSKIEFFLRLHGIKESGFGQKMQPLLDYYIKEAHAKKTD